MLLCWGIVFTTPLLEHKDDKKNIQGVLMVMDFYARLKSNKQNSNYMIQGIQSLRWEKKKWCNGF